MKLTRQMLFPLAFYKKSKFHGSRGRYNFRIEKYDEEGAEGSQFRLTVWEGPECFDAAQEKEKQISLYPFTDEGMEEIIGTLNAL